MCFEPFNHRIVGNMCIKGRLYSRGDQFAVTGNSTIAYVCRFKLWYRCFSSDTGKCYALGCRIHSTIECFNLSQWTVKIILISIDMLSVDNKVRGTEECVDN